MELYSKFETQVVDFVDFALQINKSREDAVAKISQLEEKLIQATKEIDLLKKEKLEEREAQLAKDRKFVEEKATFGVELEKLRVLNEEWNAKCEVYRTKNEELQAVASQSQVHTMSSQPNLFALNQGSRLSQLVNKEVVDQVSTMQDHLKTLEVRINKVSANAAFAENRMADVSKAISEAHETVRLAKNQVEQFQESQRMSSAKGRQDAITISALRLDVESLNEQVNRYKEEIQLLNQHRRSLESDLNRTKLTMATSLMPLLKKHRQDEHLPSEAVPEQGVPVDSTTSLALEDAPALPECEPSIVTAVTEQKPTFSPQNAKNVSLLLLQDQFIALSSD